MFEDIVPNNIMQISPFAPVSNSTPNRKIRVTVPGVCVGSAFSMVMFLGSSVIFWVWNNHTHTRGLNNNDNDNNNNNTFNSL